MTYHELMDRQQKEFEAFPAFYAFNNEQFEEGKKRLGVVEDTELYRGYAGMFYRKKDATALHEMMRRFDEEKQEAFKDDKFFYDAAYSELANHEYALPMKMRRRLMRWESRWKSLQQTSGWEGFTARRVPTTLLRRIDLTAF